VVDGAEGALMADEREGEERGGGECDGEEGGDGGPRAGGVEVHADDGDHQQQEAAGDCGDGFGLPALHETGLKEFLDECMALLLLSLAGARLQMQRMWCADGFLNVAKRIRSNPCPVGGSC
jgi:hypothetical protein